MSRLQPAKEPVAPALVPAEPQRSANVVEDDGLRRERAGESRQVRELRVVEPGIEREAEPAQRRKAFPELGVVAIEVRRRIGVAVVRFGALSSQAAAWRMPFKRGPAAAMCARSTSSARVPIVRSTRPTIPAAAPRRAVAAARRHGGDAVDELGLAQGAQLRRTVGAVAGRALDEHGQLDLVAAAGVGEQVGEEVAVRGEIPEVVMGVDDGEVGLQRLLLRQAQPVLADARHARGHRAMRLGHGHRRLLMR